MADFLTALNNFLNGILTWLFAGYEANFTSILLYTFGISAYTIIVWQFYRQVSKVKPFGEHDVPLWLDVGLYLFTLPLFTFFWFFLMIFFVITTAEIQDVVSLISISAGMVGAIRVAAYVNEDLSEELASLLPLVLLAIIILSPQLLSLDAVVERVLSLPNHIGLIFRYMLFLVALEWFFAGIIAFAHFEQKRKIEEKRSIIRLGSKRNA